MATIDKIEEQMKRQEKIASELDMRIRMYEDIHSIKKWVKFFGIITVIGMIAIILGIA